jgi:hypothetical protein
MTQTQRYKYPLQLPQSLKETAARLAQEDGVSLNQWIISAVAQKIGAVETANEFLKADEARCADRLAGQGARCAAAEGRHHLMQCNGPECICSESLFA